MIPEAVRDKHIGQFEWGVSDCVHFAADFAEAVTGQRPPLPAYTSEREALRLLSEESLRDRVQAVMGEPVIPKLAEYGDIVVTAFDEMGQVVGVADPPVFWLKGTIGLVPVEMNLALWVYPCRRPLSRSY